MSIQCLAYALETFAPTNPNHLRQRVFNELCNSADADGLSCYPGQPRIAKNCCCSESAVREHIKALEQQGEIVVLRPQRQGRGHFNRYGIVMGRDPITVKEMVADQLDGKLQPLKPKSTPTRSSRPTDGSHHLHEQDFQARQREAAERLAGMMPDRKDLQ